MKTGTHATTLLNGTTLVVTGLTYERLSAVSSNANWLGFDSLVVAGIICFENADDFNELIPEPMSGEITRWLNECATHDLHEWEQTRDSIRQHFLNR